MQCANLVKFVALINLFSVLLYVRLKLKYIAPNVTFCLAGTILLRCGKACWF